MRSNPRSKVRRNQLSRANSSVDRPRLRHALQDAAPEEASAERAVIEAALRGPTRPARAPAQEILPGLRWQQGKGKLVLSGTGLDETLLTDLRDWLASRGKK